MSTDSVTTAPQAASSSPEATPASDPTPQVGGLPRLQLLRTCLTC